ncbi:MAG: TonB-dependent receptor [Magnetococcales bacterium]|nr:TonB-dependent receptor [Magnetococcales bacterium]
MNRLTYLTLLSLLYPTSVVFSDDTPPDPSSTVDEMVVTATRFPTKRTTIPAHVTTLTHEEIRASSATSIPELLRGQAGIHVMDMTGNGRNFIVDLRGFGESAATNVLVLVDGRRLNQADLGGVDWARIPLEQVERVEIIRGGSGGVLYGDNASGGVINILTRSGQKDATEIKLQAGSHGRAKSHLTVEGNKNQLSYSLSAGYRTEDGYRDNGDIQAREGGAKLRFQPNNTFGIDVSAGYQNDATGMPSALKESDFAKGMSRRSTLTPDDFSKVTDTFIHIIPEIAFRGEDRFLVDLSWRDREVTNFSNFTGGQFTGQNDTQVWGISPRTQLHAASGLFSDRLTVGGDYLSDHESIRNDSLFFGTRTLGDFSLRKRTLGGYAHNEIQIDKRWSLTQGVRIDRAMFDFLPSTPERVNLDQQAYSFGMRYDLNDQNHLYLHGSKSYRYPLLDEQYSFFTNTVNTALKPQRSVEWQLGWHRDFSPTLSGELSGFSVMTRDELYFDILTYNNANLNGSVRRNGVELELEKRYDQWSVSGNVTWTEAEIRSGIYSGKDFPGVPSFQSGAKVKYLPTDRFTWEWSGRYVGSRPFISDFSNAFGDQSGYVVLDTGLRYKWTNVTGWFDVTNLTGREYAEYGVLGGFPVERAWFPSAERRFMIGATARF